MFFGGRDNDNRNPLLALLVIIVAPIAAMLIQFAISRSREFEADRGGAEISGDPRALADALVKIERYAKGVPLETVESHPATAQMMIINPLSGGGIAGLFSTHPPTEERVARLLAMAT
jgi:heat shock protein HtpX